MYIYILVSYLLFDSIVISFHVLNRNSNIVIEIFISSQPISDSSIIVHNDEKLKIDLSFDLYHYIYYFVFRYIYFSISDLLISAFPSLDK